MEWTKPLSAALAVLIVVLTVGSVIELFRTTFAVGDTVIASIVTMALVVVFVALAILTGARSKEWLSNPESYW